MVTAYSLAFGGLLLLGRRPSLYHMVIDSTAIPLGIVIELILTAARAHSAAAQDATARS